MGEGGLGHTGSSPALCSGHMDIGTAHGSAAYKASALCAVLSFWLQLINPLIFDQNSSLEGQEKKGSGVGKSLEGTLV